MTVHLCVCMYCDYICVFVWFVSDQGWRWDGRSGDGWTVTSLTQKTHHYHQHHQHHRGDGDDDDGDNDGDGDGDDDDDNDGDDSGDGVVMVW